MIMIIGLRERSDALVSIAVNIPKTKSSNTASRFIYFIDPLPEYWGRHRDLHTS